MGGHAFKSERTYTPRIPTALYEKTLEQIEQNLSSLFLKVAHALEAPEKLDHGDIDILVLPIPGLPIPTSAEVAKTLNAVDYVKTNADGMMHIAVLWPANEETSRILTESPVYNHQEDINATATKAETTSLPEQHKIRVIQIDLKICSSQQDVDYLLFAQAHGDLVNILSSMIHHRGLTLTSEALFLRIPELESSNKKLSRVELSRNPDQIISYLDLNAEVFWQHFSTREAMMRYITTCRFYNPAYVAERTERGHNGQGKKPPNRGKLSSRYNRPLFRYWYKTFLPLHGNDSPGPSAELDREQVIDDALSYFGSETRRRYETQKREVSAMVGREKLWAGIRTYIAGLGGVRLHDTMRALRNEIVAYVTVTSTAVTPSTISTLTDIQKAYLDNDWQTVHDWAIENHAAVLERWHQVVRQNQRAEALNEHKANKYSMSKIETFTTEDDAIILQMKDEQQATWNEIMAVLGKKSKSQLQAHWKKNLQPSVDVEDAT